MLSEARISIPNCFWPALPYFCASGSRYFFCAIKQQRSSNPLSSSGNRHFESTVTLHLPIHKKMTRFNHRRGQIKRPNIDRWLAPQFTHLCKRLVRFSSYLSDCSTLALPLLIFDSVLDDLIAAFVLVVCGFSQWGHC